MNVIESFEVNDKIVKIYIDENPINPRADGFSDLLDTMVCFNSKYSLGDKHNYKKDDFNSWDELEEQIVKDHNPVVIKRLYLYNHSGITISTSPFSCRWDSGQVGFVFISRKQALENWSAKKVTKALKDKVEKYIEASVKEYDQYLIGDCYGYNIEDKDGEELESCWGFYGLDYVREEAKSIAENIKVAPKENPNQLQLNLA